MTKGQESSDTRRDVPIAVGVTCGAVLAAIGLSAVGLLGMSNVVQEDRLRVLLPVAAGLTCAAAVLALGGVWLMRMLSSAMPRAAMSRSERLGTFAGSTGMIAVSLVGTTIAYAHAVAGRTTDAVRVFDVGMSRVALIAAACCACLAWICLTVAAARLAEADIQLTHAGGRQMTAVTAATICVVTVIGAVSVLVVRPGEEFRTVEAEPVAIEAEVTGTDHVLYRMRSDNDVDKVLPAGPGYVSTDDGVTAFDGATGQKRWTFDDGMLDGTQRGRRDDTDGVAVFGTGDEQTVVVDGKVGAVGLDAMTGRVLWRSMEEDALGADYYGPLSAVRVESDSGDDAADATMIAINPRTGRERLRHALRCRPAFASSDSRLIRNSCDDSATVEIVDLESNRVRRLTIDPPPDMLLSRIVDIGSDYFTLEFRSDDGADDLSHHLVVIDAARGVEVDRFDSASGDVSPIRGDMIIVDGPPRKGRVTGIVVRDVRTHLSSPIAGAEKQTLEPKAAHWIGTDLVVVSYYGVASIDPLRRTISPTRRPCVGGSWGQATVSSAASVPGAYVVVCDSPDYTPYRSELVAFR